MSWALFLLNMMETTSAALSGAHYNVNIIGVPKCRSATMVDDNGHCIFVPLYGNADIFLTKVLGFSGIQLLDADGTDSYGATFALPYPDPDGNGLLPMKRKIVPSIEG